jgi:hypothetical protein
LNALLIGCLGTPLRAIATDWHTALWLLAASIPATLLGCLGGMIACWPLVRIICSKVNGAPLEPGDQVTILSGPNKGIVAEVYEITRGQGGWELALLDLGPERENRFGDIFEEYSLLKINRGEHGRTNAPKLYPSVNVEGRVVTEEGTPLSNALLLAKIYDENGAHRRVRFVRTNEDGSYLIRGIADAESLRIGVLSHKSGWLADLSKRKHIVLEQGGLRTDATQIPADMIVHAQAGDTLRLEDIIAVHGVMVSGRILDIDTSRPIKGGAVEAIWGGWATSDKSGNYRVTVPPGELRVYYRGGNKLYPKSKPEECVRTMVPECGLSEVNIYLKRAEK